jgi:hypothetical protein
MRAVRPPSIPSTEAVAIVSKYSLAVSAVSEKSFTTFSAMSCQATVVATRFRREGA